MNRVIMTPHVDVRVRTAVTRSAKVKAALGPTYVVDPARAQKTAEPPHRGPTRRDRRQQKITII